MLGGGDEYNAAFKRLQDANNAALPRGDLVRKMYGSTAEIAAAIPFCLGEAAAVLAANLPLYTQHAAKQWADSIAEERGDQTKAQQTSVAGTSTKALNADGNGTLPSIAGQGPEAGSVHESLANSHAALRRALIDPDGLGRHSEATLKGRHVGDLLLAASAQRTCKDWVRACRWLNSSARCM